jgi:DNA processing protein
MDYGKEKEYLFMLSHVTGLGTILIRRLGEFFGSYECAWKCKSQDLNKTHILNEKRQDAFWEWHKKEDELRLEYEQLEQKKIRYVAHFEEEYPRRLIPYRDAPAGLFVKGKLPNEQAPSVAIVGARNCTE